jgi:hypothetical protein
MDFYAYTDNSNITTLKLVVFSTDLNFRKMQQQTPEPCSPAYINRIWKLKSFEINVLK